MQTVRTVDLLHGVEGLKFIDKKHSLTYFKVIEPELYRLVTQYVVYAKKTETKNLTIHK